MTDDTGPGSESHPDEADAEATEADARRRMEAALDAVRREVLKAATVYAVLEAAALFSVVNLLLAVLDPGWLPARVVIPDGGLDVAGGGTAAVPGSALVAFGIGLLGFLGGIWYRTRPPLVEQFEAVNPPVAESLRTARDAVERDADSSMAVRLYEEVLADLRESSTMGLLEWRRLGASLAIVLVVSLLTVQVAVVDVGLVDRPTPTTNETAGERDANYSGLRDGDEVLGAAEAVQTGNESLTARVESSGGGRELDDAEQFPGEVGGGAGGGDASSLDSQQAGFAAPEEVENADLVREYNRRIRENAGTTGDSSEDDETRDASDADTFD